MIRGSLGCCRTVLRRANGRGRFAESVHRRRRCGDPRTSFLDAPRYPTVPSSPTLNTPRHRHRSFGCGAASRSTVRSIASSSLLACAVRRWPRHCSREAQRGGWRWNRPDSTVSRRKWCNRRPDGASSVVYSAGCWPASSAPASMLRRRAPLQVGHVSPASSAAGGPSARQAPALPYRGHARDRAVSAWRPATVAGPKSAAARASVSGEVAVSWAGPASKTGSAAAARSAATPARAWPLPDQATAQRQRRFARGPAASISARTPPTAAPVATSARAERSAAAASAKTSASRGRHSAAPLG